VRLLSLWTLIPIRLQTPCNVQPFKLKSSSHSKQLNPLHLRLLNRDSLLLLLRVKLLQVFRLKIRQALVEVTWVLALSLLQMNRDSVVTLENPCSETL
jgi:hypothetical protein